MDRGIVIPDLIILLTVSIWHGFVELISSRELSVLLKGSLLMTAIVFDFTFVVFFAVWDLQLGFKLAFVRLLLDLVIAKLLLAFVRLPIGLDILLIGLV